MIRRAGSIALAAALAGCKVGPDYRLPPILGGRATPPVLISGSAPAYDALAPLPANWWRLYNTPLLNALVEKALVHNTDIRQSLASLEQMRAMLSESEAEATPKTSISGSSDLGFASANLGGMKVTGHKSLNYMLKGSIDYDLDLAGKLKRSIEEGEANVGEAQAQLDKMRVDTAASTASAYASACAAGLNIAVTQRSIAVAQRMLDLTQRRVNAGITASSDIAQSRSTLRQTQASLPSYIAQQRKSLFMLAVLTGDPPAAFSAAVANCAAPPILRRKIPIGDGAALIARRPDIRSAERKLAGAVADIGVNTAALYPSITLSGSSSEQKSNSFGLTTKIFSWSVGPMLSWNFPNVSVARAKIRAAKASARSALANFDGTVLSALRDTETALDALSQDIDAERLQAMSTADAGIAYSNKLRLFTGGVGQFDNVLTAENNWIKAQSSLASDTAQVSKDQVMLFMELGGGWQDAPEVAQTSLDPVAQDCHGLVKCVRRALAHDFGK